MIDKWLVAAVVAYTLFSECYALPGSELALELSAAKRAYTIGDEIDFNLRYTNRGRAPIRLLPDTESDPAEGFLLVKAGSRAEAKLVNDFEAPWVDWEQLSKAAVVLQPGGSVRRTIKARLVSSLPYYFARRQQGLFLVFPGTAALDLPGVGTYEVDAIFRSTKHHPVNRYLKKQPPIWDGSSRSNSLRLEIRARHQGGSG